MFDFLAINQRNPMRKMREVQSFLPLLPWGMYNSWREIWVEYYLQGHQGEISFISV